MRNEHRSRCPINLSLEVLGDKWSLLILRDMMFGGKRHFRRAAIGLLLAIGIATFAIALTNYVTGV